MYKKENRHIGIQNRGTAHASLRDCIGDNIKRLFLIGKGVCVYISLKVRYGHQISMGLINSIKGKIRIELQEQGDLQIGEFIMTAGPCYIKCTRHAHCKIGNRVFMNHNCSITCSNEITIGDNCNIANNVVIVDHNHKLGLMGVVDGLESTPVHIGKNVWIGANSTILRGVSIGDGAVIAAGAVVNTDIPSHEIWGGVPAKCIRKL